ncbi:hypothetical protein H6P81_019930 [Aristolochia fimbriata]|uniref:Uncharacterized protein n=1 Tax=Aristolochia fimbriata TaxID=158543 RepID=A0AAV7DUX2_ARIFI|nr:hypothetical protein H6P81_019930 [Aristolochia fimbriata]
MAASFLSRFVSEAAPPQVISVMRRRVSKILDTIVEEDRTEVSELAASSKNSATAAAAAAAYYRRKEAGGSYAVLQQKWGCAQQ